MRRDLTAALSSTPTPTLDHWVREVEKQGWAPPKVTPKGKGGDFEYVAESSSERDSAKRTGPDAVTAVQNLLLYIMRKNYGRTAAQYKAGMWDSDWTNNLQEVAEAYAKAPVFDPKAAGAWQELANDSAARYQALQQQVQVEVVDDPEPYASTKEMCDDVHHNRHFYVSRANSEHPVWSLDQNVAFRTVHDVLGHCVSGGDFGWQGENLACRAHFPLLTPNAQRALFTECFPGETLVRTTDGLRQIDSIEVGEYVLTGSGEFERVHTVFERDHDGELVEFEATSALGPIRVTPEHPFSTLVGEHERKSKRLPCNRTNCNAYPEAHRFEWVEAGNLDESSYVRTLTFEEEGDYDVGYLYVPPDLLKNARLAARRGSTHFEVDNDFLWVAGMYLAEGSPGNGTLSFGLHIEETEYLNRLRRWFENKGYGTAVRSVSENGIDFTVNSTTLSHWFPYLFGKGCSNKSIPAVLLNMPAERLRPLIEGIMDGDGYYAKNVLSQTSSRLTLQVAEICLRLGGQPGIKVRRPRGKLPYYELTEASADHKIERRRGRRGHWEVPEGNAVRVSDVRRVPFRGKVYDLGVEGDQTFVVQNLVVHNCIGQTAYGAYYRSFGPQKVAFLDEFLEPAQAQENSPSHTGVPPQQSIAPAAMPAVEPSPPVGLDQGYVAPHQESLGLTPVLTRTAALDPNHDWDAQVEVPPQNAYLAYGDPLGTQAVMDNAAKVDTGWSQLVREDGSPDVARMKQAIVNAFRVVLLSPRKDLRWNAVHYQDIADVPHDVDDPKVYWDALESRRRAWNVARGRDEEAHLVYWKPLQKFYQYVKALRPELADDEVRARADDEVWHMRMEIEQRLESEGKKLPPDELERKVDAEVAKQLDVITKPKVPDADVPDWGPQGEFFAKVAAGDPRQEMEDLALSLGHQLGPWTDLKRQGAEAQCLRCGRRVAYWTGFDGETTLGGQIGQKNEPCVTTEQYGDEGAAAPQDVRDVIELPESDWTNWSINQRGVGPQYGAAQQIMYHVAPRSARESIQQHGIDATKGQSGTDYAAVGNEPGNYLWQGLAQAQYSQETHEENLGTPWDLWQVNVAGLDLAPDPYWELNPDTVEPQANAHYTTQPITPDRLSLLDQREAAQNQQLDVFTGEDAGLYGAWMGSHLKAIAQVSRHTDEILEAALEDVREHDGTGHHFRAKVLSLGIQGVGPKVASFAWLLLQPLTSQLATIDSHMMDVLGHDFEKEMSDRDYFKYERELAAGRDAAGYSHLPLGAFQWGVWDHKRTGPGTHQDHSAMRALDPVPHHEVDWAQRTAPLRLKGEEWAKQAPEWWQLTQPARDAVAAEWDINVAPQHGRNSIPFKTSQAEPEVPSEDDEFHVTVDVPNHVRQAISHWVDQVDWGDVEHELEDPGDYHVTVLFAKEGHSVENREWAEQFDVRGYPFSVSGVKVFPSTEKPLDAVVLTLEAPEFKRWVEWFVERAKERGIEVSEYPGGYKPHLTVAYAERKPRGLEPLRLSFRCGSLYVSKPRSMEKTAPRLGWTPGRDGKGQDFWNLSRVAYGRKTLGYWWDRRKPIGLEDAKVIGEYARATETSKAKLKEFLDEHEDDIRGDKERVKDAIVTKFNRLSRRAAGPLYQERKGITLKDGTEREFPGTTNHVQYLIDEGIHPEDVVDFWAVYNDGERESLSQYYGDFWEREYERRQRPDWDRLAKAAAFVPRVFVDLGDGHEHRTRPSQTSLMSTLTERYGLSTPELWARDGDLYEVPEAVLPSRG